MTTHVWMLRSLVMTAALATLACVASAQQAQPAQRAAPRVQPGAQQQATQPGQPAARQQQFGQQRVTANRPVSESGSAQHNDEMIANCVAIDNETEIALAKLLASKTENDKVRDFANRLVKDHQQFLTQLERFGVRPMQLQARAASEGANRKAGAVAENRQNPNAQNPNQVNTALRGNEAQPAGQGQGLDFLQIKREIAEQCLASAERESKDGKSEHHDKACIGHQIGMHEYMIDALKVLRNHASSQELQQTLAKGIETSEQHLDQAKHLMHSLVGERADGESRSQK